jgi:uncharacterized protein (DUF2141 family)
MTSLFRPFFLASLLLTSFVLTVSSQAAKPQFEGVPRDLALPGTLTVVAVGDFNGDGKLDFVENNPDNSLLIVALATGKNGYTFSKLSTLAGVAVSAVDVNGDGKLDLVTVSNTIQVFLGNGDGTFASPINTTLPAGDFASSQTIADFNGDGKLDVAVALNGAVQFFWGRGDGTFSPGSSLPADRYPVVATADFNGDSNPDLVVAGTTLSVYLNLGHGTFQQHTSAAPGGTVSQIAIADFNGDHVPDVALTCSGCLGDATGVQVLLGSTNGALTATTTKTGGIDAILGAAAGDFDGDGKPDLAVLFWTGPGPNDNAFDAVTIFHGNGDGTFGGSASTPVSSRPEAAVPVDLNEDGKLDLIVSNYPIVARSSYGISILQGLGNLSFAKAPEVPTEPSAGTDAVATGDFNGDGRPDVVTANKLTSDVSVFLNQGANLSPAVNSAAGQPGEFLLVGDINNDGKLDVVVGGVRSLSASVLFGKGNGTFSTPSMVPLGVVKETTQLAMADFNGDGNLDLVALDSRTENVYVSFGLGGGLFAPAVTLTGSLPAQYLAVGDVNGDGYPDILTYQLDGFLYEFLSNGNGTFSAATRLQGFDSINGPLNLADVNGDGKLDVVFIGSPVAVLLGNGDGTFGSIVYSQTNLFEPSALALADFNGDGKLDIAAASGVYNSVVILSGNGDGSFTAASSYAAPFATSVVTTVDLNGDGKPDVISGNANGISILLNTTP